MKAICIQFQKESFAPLKCESHNDSCKKKNQTERPENKAMNEYANLTVRTMVRQNNVLKWRVLYGFLTISMEFLVNDRRNYSQTIIRQNAGNNKTFIK